jgi:ATP-dependent RNA helicase DDX5/DBP2
VHRIGRTGRAGTHGTAYSFFSKKNCGLAADMISVLLNNIYLQIF